MAEILNLTDYRNATEVDLTFIGFPFPLPEGGEKTLAFTTTVPIERVESTLAEARQNGGLCMPEGETMWILPWPPAAIRMRPAQQSRSPSPPNAA